jgi:hypothetical protein
MHAHPIHDALTTVRTLRRSLLSTERFKGWSGPTRVLSGTIALLASLMLTYLWTDASVREQLFVWAGVFTAAVVLNVGALLYWFTHDRLIQRDVTRLKPILDVIPPLAVGALFTLFLLLRRDVEPLFGVWMCMFGLTNLASRYVLPGAIALVGLFYVMAGALCLLLPGLSFSQPLAMGVVFCVGEWAGGGILYLDDRRYAAFSKEYLESETAL